MADAPSPQTVYLKDYRPPAFRIETVDLRFDLGEELTRVTATLDIRRKEDRPGDALMLHGGQDLALISLSIDGETVPEAHFSRDGETLTVDQVPDSFRLEAVTELKPQENTALEGLYKSGGMFCTQCEAEGFRKITFFLDRPDVMAVYTVRIEADKARYPVLLSNGNRVESGGLGGDRHYAVWHDPFPKPSYLFALVAGDLGRLSDDFTTRSGRAVTLNIFAAEADLPKCRHAMDSLKRAMAWDEERYGLEYDLDVFNIVAVSDFNMGAMENKSLNVFNTKYVLADPETATDQDYDGIEAVIAHEYFHNWTGNRITCRDWFQLSLKEGLTVFRDQQYSADQSSEAVKRIEEVRGLRAVQFPEDAGPMAHPVRPDNYIEINNFYTPTVYNKGAEVIRMMHTLLGERGFRAGMDLYFERHDGEAVTCDDFAAAMADANGADFAQFKLWYSQAGTPRLTLRGHFDADAKQYRLTVRQDLPDTPGQTGKAPMHIPLMMGLIGPNGEEMEAALEGGDARGERRGGGWLLHVTAPEQAFVFEGVGSKPVPSLLRGFSAPVNLDSGLSREDRLFLLAHDKDSFVRWEAGQALMLETILGLIDRHRGGEAMTLDEDLVEAVAALLADDDADPALIAEAVMLPGDGYIGQQLGSIDPEAIFQARQFVRRSLGERLTERWRAAYDANRTGAYSVAPGDKSRRSLKNASLAYLCAGGAGLDLAREQYRSADNMTDRMAALRQMADSDAPERAEVLADFYRRFKDDALVIDKWFTAQALSIRAGTLDDVIALTDHPAFSYKNPNRLRSLIGAFASANQVRFHDPSGRGYRFLVDTVLKVDPINPQAAARMLAPLARWKRFEDGRAALMKAELERLARTEPLSRDVYEIASKSLR